MPTIFDGATGARSRTSFAAQSVEPSLHLPHGSPAISRMASPLCVPYAARAGFSPSVTSGTNLQNFIGSALFTRFLLPHLQLPLHSLRFHFPRDPPPSLDTSISFPLSRSHRDKPASAAVLR